MNKENKQVNVIEEGLLAIKNRAASRDLGKERSMAKTVALHNILQGDLGSHELSEAEGWRFMILLKLARDSQGKLNVDDHVDMVGYTGLYSECRQNSE